MVNYFKKEHKKEQFDMSTQTNPLSHLFHLLPNTSAFSPHRSFHIAGHSIPDLARHYETPLYIFDRATIVKACKRYVLAFHECYHGSPVHILYASIAYLYPL